MGGMLQTPDLAADGHALPLMQHPAMARALRHLGRPAQIEHINETCQALVIRTSFGPLGSFGFASRGPIWLGPTSRQQQVRDLREAKLHLLNADGLAHDVLRNAGFVRIVSATHIAELPVAPNARMQLARCRGKWRNAYQQGLQQDLRITLETYQDAAHQWLLQADRAQQRSKRFRNLPHPVMRAYHAANPGMVRVMTARQGKSIVAGMMFLVHKPVATYYIGWTTPEGRAARAHHVMLMQAGRRLGVERLDLGTVNTEDAPGLARFKIGSGAVIRSLGGTWAKLPFC